MNEAIRERLRDERELNDIKHNAQVNRIERDSAMTQQWMNGASQIAQQGLNLYYQSELRKDEPILDKKLKEVEDKYNKVDDPEAYNNYLQARKQVIDEHLEGKGLFYRMTFNNDFRAGIEDESYARFDKNFTTSVYNKNVNNCNEIIENAERAIVTEDDISKYEHMTVYKTVADSDGIHVTSEEVQLSDLWKTDLPTDTDDEVQNQKNRKQNDFNRLLNIEYSAYSLYMSSEEAKAQVESRIDKIETNVMLNELQYMGEQYCNGLKMPDGSVKHFTKEEALEQEYATYKANTPSPYTGRTITPQEEESYREIIDTVIGDYYEKKYQENHDSLYRDTLGIWQKLADAQIPPTSDYLLPVLESYGMVELDAEGKLVSHYGIDDDTWSEIESIMKNSDRIDWSERWIAKDKEVAEDNNNDGQIDLSDLPDWALDYIATSAKTGAYYVSEKKFYKTLIGDAWFSQTTRAQINENDKETRDVISATDAVKSLMYDMAEYEAYTNAGMEAPESNHVQGIINQALTEEYGENWREKDIATEDYIRLVSQIGGGTVAEFKTNLSKVDKELQQKYSTLYDNTSDYLKMVKSGNATVNPSNRSAGLQLHGVGDKVSVDSEMKAESMFGAYDYMEVDMSYKAGDYRLIDAMLMKEGKLKVGMSIEDVNALRLAKYEANEAKRAQLLKNGFGYTDENGVPYASTYELAEKRMQGEYSEYEVAGSKFIQESIEEYKDATIDRLKLLNVFKADPITYGSDGLDEMEYESVSVSSLNMAVLLGITTFDEGSALSIEQMESIVGEGSVNAYRKSTAVKYEYDDSLTEEQNRKNKELAEAMAQREYLELLTVSTNVRLAYRVSQEIYGGEKTYDEVLTQFNLEGANNVFEKLRSAYEHEMSDIKAHPSHTNQTIPTFDTVVKQSNYETEIGDYNNKYNVFKPKTNVGDPITSLVQGLAQGNSLQFELDRVKASSLYSVNDTDKIVDSEKQMEYVLGQFINNQTLAGTVTDFVKQFDSDIIKENAWTAVFNAVYNARYDDKGNERQVTNWSDIVTNVKNEFNSRIAGTWANWATSETNSNYNTVEFGNGNTLHADVKERIYGYKLDASNGEFTLAGINSTMNRYFNSDMTKAKFEAGLAGLNDEQMYNYAIICALEANGYNVDKLDAKSSTFTDDIEKLFPEITQSGIEQDKYDARFADYIARCAGFAMYVSDIKTGDNVDLIGKPILMDAENNRYTSDKMNQNMLAQGSYLTYRSRDGQLYASVVTNDGKGTVVDLYPFTEQGRKDYEAKINKELEQALKDKNNGFGGVDLAVLFNIAYDNEALKDSSFVDNTAKKLLEQCPTYKEYMNLINQARKYINLDFPIFMPYFVGASARGEFYNGEWTSTTSDNVARDNTQSRTSKYTY